MWFELCTPGLNHHRFYPELVQKLMRNKIITFWNQEKTEFFLFYIPVSDNLFREFLDVYQGFSTDDPRSYKMP